MGVKKRVGMSVGLATAFTWFGYHCGSGFATGRQIVEYTTRHGWAGAWIPVAIWAILAVYAYFGIEFAYLTRSKDYKEFNNGFYAPFGKIATVVWDIIVVLASFVGLGSVIATAGELFLSTIGLNYWIGVALFTAMLLVGVVWGYDIITKVASGVTIPMIILMIIVIIFGIYYNFDNLVHVMSDPAIPEGDSVMSMVQDVLTYAGNQASFLPAFIAISFSFTKKSDVKVGALGGAFLNLIMHFSMALLVYSAYPWVNDDALVVLSIVQETPWTILTVVFQIIVFLALVSTGVTMIYGSMSRFSVYGKKFIPSETKRKVVWAAIFLLGSVAVSSFRLSAIVNYGYKLVGSLRLPVILIPVIVLGAWRINQAKKRIAETK